MVILKLKREYFSIIIVVLCLYLMFQYPMAVKDGVTEGLSICFYTIIPSLFPFMTLSAYITKSNILSPVYRIFSFPAKILFRQPPCSAPVIIMSMIGGFPVGIKMINDLYIREQITKEQAQRLCLFCMNGGPAFIITAVGVNMLNSSKAGIIIYISLCLSSLISGIIFSFTGKKNEKELKQTEQIQLPLSSLSASVSDSLQSVLNICAWVILFSSVTNCIRTLKFNETIYIIATSVLEVTKGCTLSTGKMPLPIITGIIGFGGLCVHCQVSGFLKNMKVKYSYFFSGRIFNCVLSALISYVLFLIFPVETDVFSNSDKITAFSFSVSAPAIFIFILMCIIMIFDIDRKKKV